MTSLEAYAEQIDLTRRQLRQQIGPWFAERPEILQEVKEGILNSGVTLRTVWMWLRREHHFSWGVSGFHAYLQRQDWYGG